MRNKLKILWLGIALLLGVPQMSLARMEHATFVFTGEMPELGDPNMGSYARLATLLKQQHDPQHFFLFSGGSLGPSNLSSLDRGSHIIDILNSLEPDAMAVAKRELSFGEDELSLRAYEAAFPLVASNLYDPQTYGPLDGILPSVIISHGKIHIGVIAVVDPVTTDEYELKRLQISEPLHAIEEQAKALRKQHAELVVLIYSSTLPFLPHLLNDGTIDISLHKYNHFRPDADGLKINNPRDVFVTEPGSAAIIHAQWQAGDRRSLSVSWKSVAINDYPEDADVAKQVASYIKPMERLLKEPIGKTLTALDTRQQSLRTQEDALGDFIADAVRDHTNSDIALINSGSVRGDRLIPANSKINRLDIAKMLPFRNNVVMLNISGGDLKPVFEHSVSKINELSGRFLQISGLKVQFDSSAPVGNRIKSIEINGQPVNNQKRYTVATLDYLADGGDGYVMLSQAASTSPDNYLVHQLSDIVTSHIMAQHTIAPRTDNRLIDIKPLDREQP